MISKRNTRRVIIGENAFRYKVSTTPQSKGIYRLNITIVSESDNGSKLVVTGLIQKDTHVLPRSSYLEQHFYPTVTKHEVEWLVEQAISKGWNYSSSGPMFTLEVGNEIFYPGYRCEGFTSIKASDWDEEIERDITVGKLDKLAAEAIEEFKAGKTRSI